MTALGREFAGVLTPGDVVLLHGNLGSGKTTLTKGIALGLGVDTPVQSPTFTIVSELGTPHNRDGRCTVYHLDLYRLADPGELESIGWEQYISPEMGISIIEWPERAGDWLPDRFWLIRIEHGDEESRRVHVSRHGQGLPE